MLTEFEKSALEEFKEKIKDCQLGLLEPCDNYLIKWLIARNYDVEKAEKMFRQSLEWRRLNNVDQILETYKPPEVVVKYTPLTLIGNDKFGCPVWLTTQGQLDFNGMIQSLTEKESMRNLIWSMEVMAREIRLAQKHQPKAAYQQTLVIDMDGMPMKTYTNKHALNTMLDNLRITENNYPESLRRIFYINTSKMFLLLFNSMKSFLSHSTLDRLKIFGTNKEEWQAALLEEIDACKLPAFYGGTMIDPDGDPKCPSKINLGGEIPKSYYLCNNKPTIKCNMKSLKLDRASKKQLEFKIELLCSIIKWEFMTEDGDISFGVYFKGPNHVTEIIPNERVDSHLITEEGRMTCDSTGTYIFEFDNSYSYLKSKKIHYAITIDTPE